MLHAQPLGTRCMLLVAPATQDARTAPEDANNKQQTTNNKHNTQYATNSTHTYQPSFITTLAFL